MVISVIGICYEMQTGFSEGTDCGKKNTVFNAEAGYLRFYAL